VGSEAARQADLARDRERKRRKKLGLPPLPAIRPGPMAGPAEAEPPPLVAQPGTSEPPPANGDFGGVPWSADLLRPIFEQGVPVAEAACVANLTDKARAAKLDASLVQEVAAGAKFHPLAKQQIIEGGAAVAAKWLNKSGVSAEHADEVRLLGGLVAVIAGYRTVAAKLDELKAQPAPVPPAKEAPGHAPA
jgi:hypothetical protein